MGPHSVNNTYSLCPSIINGLDISQDTPPKKISNNINPFIFIISFIFLTTKSHHCPDLQLLPFVSVCCVSNNHTYPTYFRRQSYHMVINLYEVSYPSYLLSSNLKKPHSICIISNSKTIECHLLHHLFSRY